MNLIRSTSRLLIIDRGIYARSYQYHMKTFATSPAACKRLEKRAKTWDSKELCQLLSDSDGWDDLVASPVKPQVAAKTNGNRELELSEDDDDDDILILSEICPPKGHLQGPAKPSNIEKFNSSSTFEIRAPVNSRTQLDQFLERVSSQRKPTVELLRPSLCGSDERVVAQETLRVEQEDRTPTNKLGPPLLVGSEIKDSHFKEEEVLTQVSRSPSFDEPSASASLEDETNTRFAERKRPSLRSRNHELVFLTQKTDREASEEPASRTNSMINKKLVQGLVLSEEQESVIELAKEGYNIFYTGSAGTGKSVLLRVLIKTLRRKYGQGSVAITASTGLAACNIGGITVHSFAGFGLGVGDNKTLLKKVKRSKKHVVRWMSIKALVIDEVSMIEGDLLDKLDYVAKNLRKDQSPFGGIQIILSGDFFQLPPVNKNSNANTNFAFHADAWKEAIDATIMLQKVFRQQGDGEFIQMLNEMRMGNISPETEIEFKKLCRPLPDDDIIPAELYSTRNEVERANMSRLRNLPGECHTYHAIDGGDLRDQETKDKLLSNFLAPKELRLKVGAQVMMIKNIDETLVNGSLGKVIDFLDQDTYMFYERVRNNPDMEFEELESIRQGKTTMYESSEDDENNQKVIRKKTLKENFCRENSVKTEQKLGDSIFDFLMSDSKDLTADQKFNIERKKKMLQDLHASSSGRKLPLVRFLTPDGSSRCVLVQPEDWAVEDEQQKPIVSRVQLPLMLAWALSIHKSQGQTLPKVKVDLRRIFEKGQAYVALSRAVSRDGLQVLNFNKTKVQAHASVMEFYKTLTSANEAKKRFDNTSGKQQTLSFAPKPAKRMGSKGKDERQDRITSMLLSKNKRKLYAAQDDQNGMSSNFRLQQRSSEGSGQAL